VAVAPAGEPLRQEWAAVERVRRREPAGREAQRERAFAHCLLATVCDDSAHAEVDWRASDSKLGSMAGDTSPSEATFGVTEKAAEHILKIMKKEGVDGQALRVSAVPGGCSGYEYSMEFAPEPRPGDEVIETGGLRVYIDRDSVPKLAGTVIDYVSGLYGGGLRFTNPKAAHTCGCGTSFSTD
jgi:iron-sulfur cluster assembly protein